MSDFNEAVVLIAKCGERHKTYARRILSAIAEAGLDCRAMPVVFLGGGAGLMKRYLPQGSVLHPVILDDDKLNAQAYERLASQVAGHAG